MQTHHRQDFGLVFGSEFLKEEHSCIIDEDIYLEVLGLTKGKQLLGSRLRSQILVMGNHLDGIILPQVGSCLLQLSLLIAHKQQVTSSLSQLTGIFQAHSRAAARDKRPWTVSVSLLKPIQSF